MEQSLLQGLHLNTRGARSGLISVVFRGASDDADPDQRSAGSSGQVTPPLHAWLPSILTQSLTLLLGHKWQRLTAVKIAELSN